MQPQEIHVSCALIEQEGKVLIAQRGPDMSNPLLWEFPGGKLLPQETPSESLIREIKEELGLEIVIAQALPLCTHHGAEHTITLYPFLCHIQGGQLVLAEHQQVRWVLAQDFGLYTWTAADVPVWKQYLETKL